MSDELQRIVNVYWDRRYAAQAGEAGTATTTEIGVVHEHAVAESEAPVKGRHND